MNDEKDNDNGLELLFATCAVEDIFLDKHCYPDFIPPLGKIDNKEENNK